LRRLQQHRQLPTLHQESTNHRPKNNDNPNQRNHGAPQPRAQRCLLSLSASGTTPLAARSSSPFGANAIIFTTRYRGDLVEASNPLAPVSRFHPVRLSPRRRRTLALTVGHSSSPHHNRGLLLPRSRAPA